MRAFPLFAVLFFVIPLIEIYLLIQVGEVIGALWTVFLVVLTAVLGAFLLRQQGLSTLARFQRNMGQGQLPAQEMLEGVVLVVGGALLMTPGFFTDTLGFLCLFPLSRILIVRGMMKQATVRVMSGQAGAGPMGGAGGSPFEEQPTAYTQTDQARGTTTRTSTRTSSRTSSQTTTLEGEFIRKDEP